MQTKSFSLKMSDGCEIFLNRWMPDPETEIKGIIQLHHGLAEHSMRYDRFGSVLADNGYILNAYDMRGHGKTAEKQLESKTGMFGKLADKNGFDRVVEDLHEVLTSFKNEYKGKKTILIGHSFGSFVSQRFIEKYGDEIDGCALIGTAGPRRALASVGNIFANIVKVFCGPDSIVKLLDKMSFGSYNERFPNAKSSNAWLSRNENNIELYEMDKWCGFKLTTSFFCDLTSGLKQIHNKKNMKNIPHNLPIAMFYGSDDPVGTYGKTIKKLMDEYTKLGIENLSIMCYDKDRHEILNEDDKEKVEKDIIYWIEHL